MDSLNKPFKIADVQKKVNIDVLIQNLVDQQKKKNFKNLIFTSCFCVAIVVIFILT